MSVSVSMHRSFQMGRQVLGYPLDRKILFKKKKKKKNPLPQFLKLSYIFLENQTQKQRVQQILQITHQLQKTSAIWKERSMIVWKSPTASLIGDFQRLEISIKAHWVFLYLKSQAPLPLIMPTMCRLSNLLIQWDLILCKLIKKHHLYAWYIKSGGFLVFGFWLSVRFLGPLI